MASQGVGDCLAAGRGSAGWHCQRKPDLPVRGEMGATGGRFGPPVFANDHQHWRVKALASGTRAGEPALWRVQLRGKLLVIRVMVPQARHHNPCTSRDQALAWSRISTKLCFAKLCRTPARHVRTGFSRQVRGRFANGEGSGTRRSGASGRCGPKPELGTEWTGPVTPHPRLGSAGRSPRSAASRSSRSRRGVQTAGSGGRRSRVPRTR